MEPQEMTEAEQRALHDGLRILARLIARHHLAQQETVLESCAPPASAEEEFSSAESEGMGS